MANRILDAIRKTVARGSRGHARWDVAKQEVDAEIEIRLTITEDELDGGFVVECLNLPGCMSQGDTVEEAVENMGEALFGVLAARFERDLREQEAKIETSGDPAPKELSVPLRLGNYADDRVLV
jgi:predicted RNase H-like HicB family nuclease